MITQLRRFLSFCNSLFKMNLLRAKLWHFQRILHFPFRVPPALAMHLLWILFFQTEPNHFLQFGLHLLWGGSKGQCGLKITWSTAGLVEIGILEHRDQARPLFQALKHLLGVFPQRYDPAFLGGGGPAKTLFNGCVGKQLPIAKKTSLVVPGDVLDLVLYMLTFQSAFWDLMTWRISRILQQNCK